jgi:hypothetical protein
MSGNSSSEGETKEPTKGTLLSPLFRAFLFVILLETILRLRDIRPGLFKIEDNNSGPCGSKASSSLGAQQVAVHTEEEMTFSQIKEGIFRNFGIIGQKEGSLKYTWDVMEKVESFPFLFVGSIGRCRPRMHTIMKGE